MEADFGHYRLLAPLGEGGMGQVFRAYDSLHDREVALKVLAPHVAQDPTFEQRFRREAHIAARMNEPHVVPIHSYGEIDGRLYVDMRLIAGRDLGSVLQDSGAMSAHRVVGIVEQVADALDAAHAIGLVHRDIKPSNILLGKRDFVHLIDFGIAQDINSTRITKTGYQIGTFAYMAPERIETGEARPSSDTYSLVCVLYECLTGHLPFQGDSLQQQIAGHLSKPPPRPSAFVPQIGSEFDEVIARGMAKNPSERYETVTAFAEAARAALDGGTREFPPHAMQTQEVWRASTHQTDADSARPTSPIGTRPVAHSVRFLAPGILMSVFAVLSCLLVTLSMLDDRNRRMTRHYLFGIPIHGLLYLILWAGLAAAFALVARRASTHRGVARAAWIACAATSVGFVPWGALFLQGYAPRATEFFLVPTFVAIVAFGVVSGRTFGPWWSASAIAAGVCGLIGCVWYEFSYLGAIEFGVPSFGGLWLLPLFAFGTIMCRTRIATQDATS